MKFQHNGENMRLDKCMSIHLTEFSREQCKKLIISVGVLINERHITSAKHMVYAGDMIEYNLPISKKIPNDHIISTANVVVVYEDSDLLVINKPSGLVVHSGANTQETLVDWLRSYRVPLSDYAGEDRPGIVHRLDKDTSGLLVVAKNNNVHALLSKALKERLIKRNYLALSYGSPTLAQGCIDTFFGRSKVHRTRMQVLSYGARRAITHYQVKWSNNEITLFAIQLNTGRTHQIRVHLTHIGCPIIGDYIYGKGLNFNLTNNVRQITSGIKRQMLHAESLSFTHPKSNESLFFNALLPNDMQNLVDNLYYNTLS